MLRRIRKWWLCRRHGICPVHGVLRPHAGYGDGLFAQWGLCPKCRAENFGKSHMRDLDSEKQRQAALERLNRDWRGGAGI